jgi:hypothetical protein
MTPAPTIRLAPAQIRGLRRLYRYLPIIWAGRYRLHDHDGKSPTAKRLKEHGLIELSGGGPRLTNAGIDWVEAHP